MSQQVITAETTNGLPAGFEVGTESLAVSLARAEVDQQITTAHAFPRQIGKVVKNITDLAMIDAKSAEECIYALPRGGKPIKGPSIRLAEVIAGQWGNCRVGTRVVHVDRVEKYIEAEGVFHDLETNTATTARVRRRISDKHGRLLNEDMIVVTGNAACSIAKRNAILAGVPKAVWRQAYDAAEGVVVGDIKTLAERRDRAVKALAAYGVTPEKIYEALEIAGIDDINGEHLTTLTGMRSALKSGESTVEEMFPTVAKRGDALKSKASLADKMGALAGDAPADTAKPNDAAATARSETAAAASPPAEASEARSATEAKDQPAGGTNPSAEETLYDAGAAAYRSGKARTSCPDFGDDERSEIDWLNGYDDAQAESGA